MTCKSADDFIEQHPEVFPSVKSRYKFNKKIWDFFFEIKEDILLGPHYAKIGELEREAEALKQNFHSEFSTLENNRKDYLSEIHSLEQGFKVKCLHMKEAARRYNYLIYFSSAIMIVFTYIFMMDFLCFVASLSLLLLMTRRDFGGKQKKNLKRRMKLDEKLKALSDHIQYCDDKLDYIKKKYEYDSYHKTEEIKSAVSLLEQCRKTIPLRTDKREVIDILKLQIEKIKSRAMEDTSTMERLKNGLGQSVFHILTPACIQDDLPSVYLDEETDRHHHLHAKREFGRETIYAVYKISFILIGTNMIGLFNCFFDLIESKIICSDSSIFDYSDIVSIGQARVSKKVFDGAKAEYYDDLPSLSLTFMDGNNKTINFFDSENPVGDAIFNPKPLVEAAIRSIKESVNVSKRRREREYEEDEC